MQENGAGRLVRVTDESGTEERGYDALGDLVRTRREVKPLRPGDGAQSFETRFTFDSFGRMLTLTYPDGESLQPCHRVIDRPGTGDRLAAERLIGLAGIRTMRPENQPGAIPPLRERIQHAVNRAVLQGLDPATEEYARSFLRT